MTSWIDKQERRDMLWFLDVRWGDDDFLDGQNNLNYDRVDPPVRVDCYDSRAHLVNSLSLSPSSTPPVSLGHSLKHLAEAHLDRLLVGVGEQHLQVCHELSIRVEHLGVDDHFIRRRKEPHELLPQIDQHYLPSWPTVALTCPFICVTFSAMVLLFAISFAWSSAIRLSVYFFSSASFFCNL